jgi:hypothetical protein
LKRQTNNNFSSHDTIGKVLKEKIPKMPLHCSFGLEMHELQSKEKLGIKPIEKKDPF